MQVTFTIHNRAVVKADTVHVALAASIEGMTPARRRLRGVAAPTRELAPCAGDVYVASNGVEPYQSAPGHATLTLCDDQQSSFFVAVVSGPQVTIYEVGA